MSTPSARCSTRPDAGDFSLSLDHPKAIVAVSDADATTSSSTVTSTATVFSCGPPSSGGRTVPENEQKNDVKSQQFSITLKPVEKSEKLSRSAIEQSRPSTYEQKSECSPKF